MEKLYNCTCNDEPKICPHETISGALCSACKKLDEYMKEKIEKAKEK